MAFVAGVVDYSITTSPNRQWAITVRKMVSVSA